jgi:L-ornithine N5-oxygenase
VISPGGTPRIPPAFSLIIPHPKVIHSSSYAISIPSIISSITSEHITAARPIRIAVIGSGQSSAEVVLDLHNRLGKIPIVGGGKRHCIELFISKGSLKPSDDSQFSNEIFDPDCESIILMAQR